MPTVPTVLVTFARYKGNDVEANSLLAEEVDKRKNGRFSLIINAFGLFIHVFILLLINSFVFNKKAFPSSTNMKAFCVSYFVNFPSPDRIFEAQFYVFTNFVKLLVFPL